MSPATDVVMLFTRLLQGHSSGAAAAMRFAEADKVAGELQHWKLLQPHSPTAAAAASDTFKCWTVVAQGHQHNPPQTLHEQWCTCYEAYTLAKQPVQVPGT
jgi:hypothetical protein